MAQKSNFLECDTYLCHFFSLVARILFLRDEKMANRISTYCPLTSIQIPELEIHTPESCSTRIKREESDFEKHILNLVYSWDIP